MSHDDGWRFLMSAAWSEPNDGSGVSLSARRGCDLVGRCYAAAAAYESFLRTYRGWSTPAGGAALLLNRPFPRSVYAAVATPQQCLTEADCRTPRATRCTNIRAAHTRQARGPISSSSRASEGKART